MAGPLALLPLDQVDDRTWDLPVTLGLCSGLRSLWGGCGLGAAVLATEETSGRPCRWATVQYLRPIHPDQLLRLSVSARDGRSLTQAQVTGTVDGVQVLGDDVRLKPAEVAVTPDPLKRRAGVGERRRRN